MNSYNLNCFDEMTVNNNRLPVTQMDCTLQNVPKKRRLDENPNPDTTVFPIGCGKRFIPVRRNSGVYMTEDWKLTGSSLFKPVVQDLFVNTDKYDQLSVVEGSFFVADDTGRYCKSVTVFPAPNRRWLTSCCELMLYPWHLCPKLKFLGQVFKKVSDTDLDARGTALAQEELAGKVLHLWRYDKTEKQLFIALSLLYTCPQEFCVLQALLNSL